MLNKRSYYSFSLERPEKINLYYNLMKRDEVSVLIRANDSTLIEDAINILSNRIHNERVYAVVGTDHVNGKDFHSIYLTYNKGEVNEACGDLFVITKYKLIYLGNAEEYNDTLILSDLRDVEGLLWCTSRIMKLTYATAKRIIKSVYESTYFEVPEFFNILSKKILPDLLPSSEINRFLEIAVIAASLGRTKIHVLNETSCYLREKENYLNHLMVN